MGRKRYKTGNEDKRETLEKYIQEGGVVMLMLDARVEGVRVPDYLKECPMLRLNISPNFLPHDLVIDEDGVRQTLSFKGSGFHVIIPWEALSAICAEDGHARTYLLSVPSDITDTFMSPEERFFMSMMRDDGSQPLPVIDSGPVGPDGECAKVPQTGEYWDALRAGEMIPPPGIKLPDPEREFTYSLLADEVEETPKKRASKSRSTNDSKTTKAAEGDSASEAVDSPKPTRKRKLSLVKMSPEDAAAEATSKDVPEKPSKPKCKLRIVK